MEVTDPDPLGLGSFIPSTSTLGLGTGGKLKGQIDYGIRLETDYNSNFFLSESNEKSELTAHVLPWVRYNSDPEGGAKFTILANYEPTLRTYQHNTDLNGVDQAGEIALRFQGVKTGIDLFSRYAELSGSDRLTGDFVQGSVITSGIRATRQLAPRTALNAGWSAAMSQFDSNANEGAQVYTSYVGGLWDATERISFGPTVRYTVTESDNTGTRDAWALMLEARYKVGERIWLSASVGPEYATNSGSGTNDDSSLGLTGELSAKYVINDRWTWLNNVRSVTVPSPNETNYLVNDVMVTTTLQRQFVRSTMSGGMEYRFSGFEDVGTVTTNRGNEQNMSLFVAYNRPLFSDRVKFDSTLRYSFNDGQTDWSQFIISMGLETQF